MLEPHAASRLLFHLILPRLFALEETADALRWRFPATRNGCRTQMKRDHHSYRGNQVLIATAMGGRSRGLAELRSGAVHVIGFVCTTV